MKTRAQIYEREAAALLRDISMYQVMTEGQLLRLHPGKKDKTRNLLAYLVRQNRVWQVDDFYCAAQDSLENMDRGLLAAVWVCWLTPGSSPPATWCWWMTRRRLRS